MTPADEARVREIVREELQARDRGRCEAYRAAIESDLARGVRFAEAIRTELDRQEREQLKAFDESINRYLAERDSPRPTSRWRWLCQRIRHWLVLGRALLRRP